MRPSDCEWVSRRIAAESKARDHELDELRSEVRSGIVVGVCGYCGGALLAGRYYRDEYHRGTPPPKTVLFCASCNARASLTVTMVDRRKQSRPEVKPAQI